MRVGSVLVFIGYIHQPLGGIPIFIPGDLLVIIEVEDDGVVRCCGYSLMDGIARWRSDTLFEEEVVLLNNAPLIAHANVVGRSAAGSVMSSRN